jgi:hypothetical protein
MEGRRLPLRAAYRRESRAGSFSEFGVWSFSLSSIVLLTKEDGAWSLELGAFR